MYAARTCYTNSSSMTSISASNQQHTRPGLHKCINTKGLTHPGKQSQCDCRPAGSRPNWQAADSCGLGMPATISVHHMVPNTLFFCKQQLATQTTHQALLQEMAPTHTHTHTDISCLHASAHNVLSGGCCRQLSSTNHLPCSPLFDAQLCHFVS
jgi:hypothetical protein